MLPFDDTHIFGDDHAVLAHPDEDSRRDLGAYYTPKEIGSLLAKFCIRSSSDTVLEPSFGGAGLLVQSIAQLQKLGCKNPIKQIFGCDIDPHAFAHLPNVVGGRFGKAGRRFVESDFLSLKSNDFLLNKFDVVLGNPPYIGYRKMSESQRIWSKGIKEYFELAGSRYAGTWYFFVLKSLQFLEVGGRVAFVLPYALIDADYARPLRALIAEHFSKSTVFAFSERFFLDQGTRERIVVLVADGWSPKEKTYGKLDAEYVSGLDDFDVKLNSFMTDSGRSHYLGTSIGKVSGRISNSDINLLNSLKANASTKTLGQYLDIKIGLVAGDIKFFTFNQDKIEQHSLKKDVHLTPVLRSLKNNPGLSFKTEDLQRNLLEKESVYLLKYHEEFLEDDDYVKYLGSYDLGAIDDNKTLKSREIWCDVDDGLTPDIFLAYMNISGPRIVINADGVNCFNNTHRGYFKIRASDVQKQIFSISILTSFTQIVAELESKQYGSKTIKLEPKTYLELPVLIPTNCDDHDVVKVFRQIDSLLRHRKWHEASDTASLFIYSHVFNQQDLEDVLGRLKRTREMLEADRRESN